MRGLPSYKLGSPPMMSAKNFNQKFKSYAVPKYSLLQEYEGKAGDYKEDGHKYKELCCLCGKAFGDHFDNHCKNGRGNYE